MKSLIIALIVSASAVPAFAGQFYAAPEYQNDFQNARQCRGMLNGRLVWKGQDAYYIQSNEFYTDESGAVAGDAVTTIFLDNTHSSLKPFRKACS